MFSKIQSGQAYGNNIFRSPSLDPSLNSALANQKLGKSVMMLMKMLLSRAGSASLWKDYQDSLDWFNKYKDYSFEDINKDPTAGQQLITLMSQADQIYGKLLSQYKHVLNDLALDPLDNADQLSLLTLSGKKLLEKLRGDPALRASFEAAGYNAKALKSYSDSLQIQLDAGTFARGFLDSDPRLNLGLVRELNRRWKLVNFGNI